MTDNDPCDVDRHVGRPFSRLTLEDMFLGKTPAEWRELYSAAFDWGPDIGREVVEE